MQWSNSASYSFVRGGLLTSGGGCYCSPAKRGGGDGLVRLRVYKGKGKGKGKGQR